MRQNSLLKVSRSTLPNRCLKHAHLPFYDTEATRDRETKGPKMHLSTSWVFIHRLETAKTRPRSVVACMVYLPITPRRCQRLCSTGTTPGPHFAKSIRCERNSLGDSPR